MIESTQQYSDFACVTPEINTKGEVSAEKNRLEVFVTAAAEAAFWAKNFRLVHQSM